MAERPELSLALEHVRVMLFPNLDPEDGRARVQAAIEGQADIDTWKRIEDIAAREPDLFTHLFDALREAQQRRRDD